MEVYAHTNNGGVVRVDAPVEGYSTADDMVVQIVRRISSPDLVDKPSKLNWELWMELARYGIGFYDIQVKLLVPIAPGATATLINAKREHLGIGLAEARVDLVVEVDCMRVTDCGVEVTLRLQRHRGAFRIPQTSAYPTLKIVGPLGYAWQGKCTAVHPDYEGRVIGNQECRAVVEFRSSDNAYPRLVGHPCVYRCKLNLPRTAIAEETIEFCASFARSTWFSLPCAEEDCAHLVEPAVGSSPSKRCTEHNRDLKRKQEAFIRTVKQLAAKNTKTKRGIPASEVMSDGVSLWFGQYGRDGLLALASKTWDCTDLLRLAYTYLDSPSAPDRRGGDTKVGIMIAHSGPLTCRDCRIEAEASQTSNRPVLALISDVGEGERFRLPVTQGWRRIAGAMEAARQRWRGAPPEGIFLP